MATYIQITRDIHLNSFNRRLEIDTKCCHLLAITLCPTCKPENFCIFVISNNKSFIYQVLKVVGPLGGNSYFFSASRFEMQRNFDLKTSKSNSLSWSWLKHYLSEKCLIHGRETAMISQFSALIFETYFSCSFRLEHRLIETGKN